MLLIVQVCRKVDIILKKDFLLHIKVLDPLRTQCCKTFRLFQVATVNGLYSLKFNWVIKWLASIKLEKRPYCWANSVDPDLLNHCWNENNYREKTFCIELLFKKHLQWTDSKITCKNSGNCLGFNKTLFQERLLMKYDENLEKWSSIQKIFKRRRLLNLILNAKVQTYNCFSNYDKLYKLINTVFYSIYRNYDSIST